MPSILLTADSGTAVTALQLTLVEAIDAEMRGALDYGSPRANQHQVMAWYQMGWVDCGERPASNGKAIRPLLTLLSTIATEGAWPQALPFAAAVELVHNFSLVHDDIQDGGLERRGRPSVWAKWGKAQAINVGDALFASAHEAALRDTGLVPEQRIRAAQTLIGACVALSKGQHLDLSFESRTDVSVDEYLTMVRGKTAALLAAACELGGIASGVSRTELQMLRAFGEHLGIAFQIRDDLLGIWGDPRATGKPANDIADGKKTLPILLGAERSHEVRARLERAQRHGVEDVLALLEEVGALRDAEQSMLAHAKSAIDALDAVAQRGTAKDALAGLVSKAVDVSSLKVEREAAAA